MKLWKGTHHRYAHVKRDGHMVLVKKLQTGEVRFYSKNMIPFNMKWHPVAALIYSRVPYETTLHCELWREGRNASYVKSGIVNEDKDLTLEVFAVPTLDHQMPLHELADQVQRWGLSLPPWYSLVKPNSDNSGSGDWHELRLGIRKVDDLPMELSKGSMEGYVMKDSNFSEFYKHKPFMTADLEVVAVKPGKRKYTGQVGALICANGFGEVIANVSGMSDEQRLELSDQDIGRIVEVKYQYVGDGGRLRHPTFVRFRDDKDVADESV